MLFQISVTGIHELVKNCPSLNVLNLSECQSIDDKAVKDITTNVRMLKELYIDRCYKLTDHSLDSIALECKYIKVSRSFDYYYSHKNQIFSFQVLDVRGCRGMCPEPGLRLKTVQSLRNLMASKPGPYSDPSLSPHYCPQAPPYRISF